MLYCLKRGGGGGRNHLVALHKGMEPRSVPLIDCAWITVPFEWQWPFIITLQTFIATVVL